MRWLFILVLLTLNTGFFSKRCRGDVLFDETISKHVKDAKKRGLSACGTGGSIPEKIESFFVSYESHQSIDIPGARALISDLTKNFMHHANSNKEIAVHSKNYPFNLEKFDIIINFVDFKSKYIKKPFLASVIKLENKVIYYSSDDGQDLKKIKSEILEDL